MYDRDNHPDMHRLSAQQHNSLDKHRQMIDNALRWRSHHRQVTPEEQTAARLRLRTDFAVLLTRLMK